MICEICEKNEAPFRYLATGLSRPTYECDECFKRRMVKIAKDRRKQGEPRIFAVIRPQDIPALRELGNR